MHKGLGQMRSLRAVAAGAFASLLGGCHEFVDFEELPAPDPVTRFTTCAPSAPNSTPAFDVKLGLTFVNNSGLPAAGDLRVKACLHRNDAPLTCDTALSDIAAPDEGGRVELVVSPGESLTGAFVPYVRVERSETYFPTSILTIPAIRGDAELPTLIAVSEGIVNNVTGLFGLDRAEVVERRGHLVVVVAGCDGVPAANVRVSIGEGLIDEKTVYFSRGSEGSLGRNEEVTRDDGILVFLGLPMAEDVASVPLQLYDELSGGQPVFPPTVRVPVRRGEATMVVVDPRLGG